jgi:micrococcal nuclease
MKRMAVRLLLGCALLGGALSVSACSCTPQSAEQSGATPAAQSGAAAPVVGDVAAKETVYVTDGGKKYHRVGCRTLRKHGKVALTVGEARKQGYTPCSVCDPPQ